MRLLEAPIFKDFEIHALGIGGAQSVRDDEFIANDIIVRDVAAHEPDHDGGGRARRGGGRGTLYVAGRQEP